MLLSAGDLIFSRSGIPDRTGRGRFSDAAVQADGKIVAVGTVTIGDQLDFVVARFHSDGTPDTTFSGDGYRYVNFTGRDDIDPLVALQNDGKIVIAGRSRPTTSLSDDDIAIARLLSDGSSDFSFSDDGRTLYLSTSDTFGAGGIAVTDDNRIIVGTSRNTHDGAIPPSALVLRYRTDGQLDSTFDGDGVKLISGTLLDLAVDRHGHIVALSGAGSVTRLNSNGAYDVAFANGGIASVGFDVGSTVETRVLAIGRSGEIFVAGQSYGTDLVRHSGVAKLLHNGHYDTSFNLNGRVSFHVAVGASDYLNDVAILPSGGLVVVGHGDPLPFGNSDGIIAQLTPNGSRDLLFSGDGKHTFSIGSGEGFLAVAVTHDVNYLAFGDIGPFLDEVPLVAMFEGLPSGEDLIGFHTGAWFVGRSTRSNFVTTRWAQWANTSWQALRHGDFNGDGRTDVLGLLNGAWWVGIAADDEFTTTRWAAWSALNWQNVTVGDVNNDGRDDILARLDGQWWVATSSGIGFRTPSPWTAWSSLDWQNVTLTDVDGDGKADLLARFGAQWWVSISTGTGLKAPKLWGVLGNSNWSFATFDANGDGQSDLVGLFQGQWWVGLSSGQGFVLRLWRAWSTLSVWTDMRVGDFNGDGRDDVFARTNGQFWLGLSTGTGLTSQRWTASFLVSWKDITIGDFNGDGRDDLAMRIDREWTVVLSNATFSVSGFPVWGPWSISPWQLIVSGEVSRSTAAASPAPVASPGPSSAATTSSASSIASASMLSDNEITARLWTSTDDDEEFVSLLLAG